MDEIKMSGSQMAKVGRGSSHSDVDRVNQNLTRASAEGIQGQLVDIKEHVGGVIHQRNETLLRFFDPRERARVAGEVRMIESELEARCQIVNLYHDAQIKATREVFEHFLMKLKLGSRRDMIEFAGQQLESVILETSNVRASLITQMEQDWARIEQIRIPILRDKLEQDYVKDVERAFSIMQKLLDDFKKATDDQLKQ